MTETKVRYQLVDAEYTAEILVGLIGPYCERIEIAGSIRRRRPDVGDMELVCIPKTETRADIDSGDQAILFDFAPAEPVEVDLLHEFLTDLVDRDVGILSHRLDSRGRKTFGKLNKNLVHDPSGIPVDVFATTPQNWGMAMFVRTGPKEWVKRAMMRFIALGHRGHASAGVTVNSKDPAERQDIDCPTEQRVFDLLEWRWRDPEHRL